MENSSQQVKVYILGLSTRGPLDIFEPGSDMIQNDSLGILRWTEEAIGKPIPDNRKVMKQLTESSRYGLKYDSVRCDEKNKVLPLNEYWIRPRNWLDLEETEITQRLPASLADQKVAS